MAPDLTTKVVYLGESQGKRKKLMPKRRTRDREGTSKEKAIWTPDMHTYWVDTCVKLVRAQMRPTTHLSSKGYLSLINRFNKEFDVNFTRKQMKNHWDATKKNWISWNGLVSDNNNSELGWNSDLGMISAPNHWWDARLKVNSAWAKWRTTPLEHCFKLDEIYQDISVTGKRAWAPTSAYLPSPTDEAENIDCSDIGLDGGALGHRMNSEHYDSDEGDDVKEGTQDLPKLMNTEHDDCDDGDNIEEGTQDLPKLMNSEHNDSDDGDDIKERTPNLRKVRKLAASSVKESKSSKLIGSQKVLQIMDSRSTATSERLNTGKMDCKRALDAMAAIPGMEVGGDLYMFGVDLLVRKEYRDMFLVLPTPELQLAFLQRKYNMSNAPNAFHSHMSRQQPFGSGSSHWTQANDIYRSGLDFDHPHQ